MNDIEDSVVASMDGSDRKLFPYLDYILQDIWEIGASPKLILELIEKHKKNYNNLSVLDLGCGKGAVSIEISKKLRCHCFGIDAVEGFIEEANKKALEYGLNEYCRFLNADIREKINEIEYYDIIVLGAIGPVFGNYYETLTILGKHLKDDGLIIIDDSYIDDLDNYQHSTIQKKEKILDEIKQSGMKLLDEAIVSDQEIKDSNDYIFNKIKKRCLELIEKYPEKTELFMNYMNDQEEENDVLETKVINSTMLIVKM